MSTVISFLVVIKGQLGLKSEVKIRFTLNLDLTGGTYSIDLQNLVYISCLQTIINDQHPFNIFIYRFTLQKPHKLQRCRIDIESISLRRRILIVMRSMSYRYLIDVVSMSIRHR